MGTYEAKYADGRTHWFTAASDEDAERDAFDAVSLTSLSDKDIAKMEADAAKARKAEATTDSEDDE